MVFRGVVSKTGLGTYWDSGFANLEANSALGRGPNTMSSEIGFRGIAGWAGGTDRVRKRR